MSIVYLKRVRDYEGYKSSKKPIYRKVQKRAWGTYDVDGVDVEMYPVSTLADAIDRDKKTLVRWEKEGKFPAPMFDLPGTHVTRKDGKFIKPRWYSKAQVMNIHNLLMMKYGGKKMFSIPGLLDLFLKDVRRIFYLRDILSDIEIKR